MIYFAGVIVILTLCAGIITMMNMQVTQCIRNPYIYGASNMGDVECSCRQTKDPNCPISFYFNDT